MKELNSSIRERCKNSRTHTLTEIPWLKT